MPLSVDGPSDLAIGATGRSGTQSVLRCARLLVDLVPILQLSLGSRDVEPQRSDE